MSKSVRAYTKQQHGNEVLRLLDYMIKNSCSLKVPCSHPKFCNYASSKPLYYRLRGGFNWLVLNHPEGKVILDLMLLISVKARPGYVLLEHAHFRAKVVTFKESLDMPFESLGLHEDDLKNATVKVKRDYVTQLHKKLVKLAEELNPCIPPTRLPQVSLSDSATAADDELNLTRLMDHLSTGNGRGTFKNFKLTERGYNFLFGEILPMFTDYKFEYQDNTLKIYDATTPTEVGSKITRESIRHRDTRDMGTLHGNSSTQSSS